MAVNRLRNYPIIILDTNALFMPFQFKLNLDSELSRLVGNYQIVIPSCILTEVRTLQTKKKYGSSALKLALKKPQPKWYLAFESEFLTHQNEILDAKDENKTDSELLQIAKAINGIVVTNDRPLLRRLHENGVRTISLRGKKYLQLN